MNNSTEQASHKGIIAWFTKNPVAANLLMIVIIVVGIGSGLVIQRAMFPNIEVPVISITIAYPGAAPEEVELGIVLKVEEALKDLEGIERLSAQANESVANIWIEPADVGQCICGKPDLVVAVYDQVVRISAIGKLVFFKLPGFRI